VHQHCSQLEQLEVPSLQPGLRKGGNSWGRTLEKGGAGHTKGDTRRGTPLRLLWPLDKPRQGRDASEGTAAHGRIHARAEEMSNKEGAVKEKSEKQEWQTNPAAH